MKATVTLEGTVEEIHRALGRLVENEPSTTRIDASLEPRSWTEDEVRTVFAGMSDGAKEIFRAIASGPEPYPISALMSEFEIDGNTIGGRMSSPTRQMRIHGLIAYPNPVSWRRYSDIGIAYQLNSVWREFLEQESEGEGGE